jgi:ABC-type sulfate transport system permease subunit
MVESTLVCIQLSLCGIVGVSMCQGFAQLPFVVLEEIPKEQIAVDGTRRDTAAAVTGTIEWTKHLNFSACGAGTSV